MADKERATSRQQWWAKNHQPTTMANQQQHVANKQQQAGRAECYENGFFTN